MNFIKTSYISAFTNVITIIVKLVVNKVAAFVGPGNFAIYGQFKDFLALATTISQLGTENGIVKYAAETQTDNKLYRKFLGTIIFVHLVSSLLTTLITFIFKNQINNLLFEGNDYSYLLSIIISSLLFLSFYNLILCLLNGLKRLRLFTLITVYSTIASGIITGIFVKLFQLNGLILSLAVSNIVLLLIAILVLKYSRKTEILIISFKPDRVFLKKLLHFSAMSISGMVSLSLSLLFIRTTIINKIGNFEAGIWDSVWRLSAIYFVFLTSSFKFYLLPTFTTVKDSLVKREILKIWKITFPLILIITLGIYIFKDLIIRILFTSEFLEMKNILLFQLLGDIFRIHSWTLGNVLMAKAKTKIFVTLQVLWGLLFCTASYFFLLIFGLKGITMGYLLTCILHFVFLNLFQYNLIWKKYAKTDL